MPNADEIRPFLTSNLTQTDLKNMGQKYAGKVRDVYIQDKKSHPELVEGRRILVATDRQSAFDKLWCSIPLKGQVLTQISAWWFDQIGHIMPTHILTLPDPNVMVVKDLKMLPIEIIVRGYLTGSTKTSAWVNYNNGIRDFCGNQLPEGMVKNQQFDAPIITPTTKGEDDELIDPDGIITQGLATKDQWEEIADKALKIFISGQEIAAKKGLILVDTKYEIGVDEDGILTIADEVHTPDSSRYWVQESYQERFDQGDEPESLDKEFFRLWLRDQGFEYGGKEPEITDDVRLNLALKYIDLYERITGNTFELPPKQDIEERIEANLADYRV